LLKFNGTLRWQEKFWSDKWLCINEATAHKKTIIYSKITELKNEEKFLYKLNAIGKNGAKFKGGEEESIMNRNTFCIE
jgi:hypothetical protein